MLPRKPVMLIVFFTILAVILATMPPATPGPTLAQTKHKRVISGPGNAWDEKNVIVCFND